ncbi:terminase small subunit [Clostridium phage phi8074-B1]|uniref:terminase small subunit n=1 Tax=Clostridium phage phi8074-B1 TaxID=1147137 RepID=UPI00025C0C34|nr:terminase small subunit [Clostridium phage phi8074-B1]AFC61933.1 putative terminase small subunit [Clostridium phage phi8074-B1]
MDYVERAQELGLTEKEHKFAHAYVETFNLVESAKRAGYANSGNLRSMAYELSRKPHVRQYIKELKNEILEDEVASAKQTLNFLTKVMNNEFESIHSNRSFLPKDRIACAELLGKYHALFTEKVETNNNVNILVDIEE